MSIISQETINIGDVCRIRINNCVPSEERFGSRLNGKTCTVYEITRTFDGIIYRCIISGEGKDYYFSRNQLRKLY